MESDNTKNSVECADVCFKKWFPCGGDAIKLIEIGRVIHELDGSLQIELRGPKYTSTNSFRIIFDAPLALRIVGEGSLLPYWRTGFTAKDHSMFMAEKSDFIEWLHCSSGGVHSFDRMKHYAIFTDDICVEILSSAKPRVSAG